MSNLLVIDKNCFQDISENILSEFVKFYNVVLPYALFIECLISEKRKPSEEAKDPVVLLNRVDRIIKTGAKLGHSLADLFKAEKVTLCPAKSLIDETSTEKARVGALEIDVDFVRKEAELCRRTFEPQIKFLSQIGKTYFKNMEKKGLCSNFRDEFEQNDLTGRFRKWLEVVDRMKNDILEHGFSDIARYIEMDWYTWQMVRFFWAWGIEWACRRNYSGPSFENRDISNDIYDIEYVAYLSRADGILTRDEKLVKPLAKAAFPEKDVFSDIRQVTKEYLCHWS